MALPLTSIYTQHENIRPRCNQTSTNMDRRLRHESDHAYQRATERRISLQERRNVLQNPDRIEYDADGKRVHRDQSSRSKVEIIAVLAIGFGTAILSKNPIAGLGAGTFCTIITYYLRRK